MRRAIILLVAAILIQYSPKSTAGVGTSLMHTADLLGPGNWELTAQADVIFNRGGGFNVSSHLRTGLLEHYLDGEIIIGTGTTNFQVGGQLKYTLLPDIDGQVGLSFLGAFTYIRDDINEESENFYLPTLTALVSKRIAGMGGHVVPYGALQYEFLFGPGDDDQPISLLAGAKWENQVVAPWAFYSEFTFSLRDSFFSFAVGAAYPF